MIIANGDVSLLKAEKYIQKVKSLENSFFWKAMKKFPNRQKLFISECLPWMDNKSN